MSVLKVEATEQPGGTVVRIAGRAGAPEAEHLEEQLARIASLRPRRLVLDLAGLEFLSSMGVSALLRLHREAKNNGTDLRFASATPVVRELLRAVKLDAIVPMHARVEDALAG
ncbi:MAG: STAS domain-containing protein [Phycisphaerae bacterium]|nr:STAS domain-containing protein [Phycisphaerae bacterium]